MVSNLFRLLKPPNVFPHKKKNCVKRTRWDVCLGGPLGGDMDAAFQYEEQAAVCTEQSYPYTAKNGQCHASACTVGIPDHGVTGFVDVKADDEEALMDAVAQQPVSVAIEADKRAFQNYQSGVLSKSLVRKNGAQKIPCNWKIFFIL